MRYGLILIGLFIWMDLFAQEVVLDGLAFEHMSVTSEKNINTRYSEFSPSYYGRSIAFVYTPESYNSIDPELSLPYFNIGFATQGEDGFLDELTPFSTTFNSDGHEGSMVYDDVFQKIYFTRVVLTNNIFGSAKGAVRQIYSFDFESQEAKPLSFCNQSYHVCHPAVSKDGTMMIFASDKHGRKDMDLYYSMLENDLWTEPQPLYGGINTDSNEFFPFMYNDDILYFASDREGMGGYDVYVSHQVNGSWSTPVLLPAPVNSTADDLGFIVDEDALQGYFSSNRDGGAGMDDIYRWQSISSIIGKISNPSEVSLTSEDDTSEMERDVVGHKTTFTLKEKLTFQPVAGAQIAFYKIDLIKELTSNQNVDMDIINDRGQSDLLVKLSLDNKRPDIVYSTNAEGLLSVGLESNATYLIKASKDEYEDYQFLYVADQDGISLDMLLDPKEKRRVIVKSPPKEEVNVVEKEIIIPTTVGETIVFDNIYYDYNSTRIQKGAARELDALGIAMLKNPNMIVQLSAHTDSRGPHAYNQALSDKRAASAKNYLVDLGVQSNRIKAIGFGESRLRNKCVDNVNCTEKQHQYNRRTEVKILEN